MHSDLDPRHIFVREGGHGREIVGVIDWEYSRYADPWSESLLVAMLARPEDDPERAALLAGYGVDPAALADPAFQQRQAIYRGIAEGWAQREVMRGQIAEGFDQPGLALEAYRRAMNEIYKGRLLFDSENVLNDIVTRNEDNPQQAMIETRAHIEAVAETIPDDIRADIEPDLFREASQRINGLAARKMDRDNRNALEELGKQHAGLEEAALRRLGT